MKNYYWLISLERMKFYRTEWELSFPSFLYLWQLFPLGTPIKKVATTKVSIYTHPYMPPSQTPFHILPFFSLQSVIIHLLTWRISNVKHCFFLPYLFAVSYITKVGLGIHKKMASFALIHSHLQCTKTIPICPQSVPTDLSMNIIKFEIHFLTGVW